MTVAAWAIVTALNLGNLAAIWAGFIPVRAEGAVADVPLAPFFLTPLTATLVHAGLLHLLFNMLMHLFCGRAIESIIAGRQFIILYVVGAYVAAAAQYAVEPLSPIPMVGASGAVSAVIGAYSLSFGRPKMITRSIKLNRWINALWLLAAWVVMQVMIGIASGSHGVMLATPAHIGGFLAGLLMQRPLLLWRYRTA